MEMPQTGSTMKRTRYDDYDVDNMTFNAKALISSWFTSGSLIDYANRLFNGLVTDYYYQSWVNFLNGVDKLLQQNRVCSTNATSSATHLAFALNFVVDDVNYRTLCRPLGDAQHADFKQSTTTSPATTIQCFPKLIS